MSAAKKRLASTWSVRDEIYRAIESGPLRKAALVERVIEQGLHLADHERRKKERRIKRTGPRYTPREVADRLVDSTLQAMRKAGDIKLTTAGWRIA